MGARTRVAVLLSILKVIEYLKSTYQIILPLQDVVELGYSQHALLLVDWSNRNLICLVSCR